MIKHNGSNYTHSHKKREDLSVSYDYAISKQV